MHVLGVVVPETFVQVQAARSTAILQASIILGIAVCNAGGREDAGFGVEVEGIALISEFAEAPGSDLDRVFAGENGMVSDDESSCASNESEHKDRRPSAREG